MSIDKWMDPDRRDEVVLDYMTNGRGRERYGVSCPKCYLRISPQGMWWAQANPANYCQCPEQYEEDSHEQIQEILVAHGVDPLIADRLRVQPNMHDATEKKPKKVKKNAKRPLAPRLRDIVQHLAE